MPDFETIFRGNLAGCSDGSENDVHLLVGGRQVGTGGRFYALVGYSIGDQLEVAGTYRLGVSPSSVCFTDFMEESGQSSFIFGGMDGSVRLIGADAFDASEKLERRESGLGGEETFGENGSRELGRVGAVAVMPEVGVVVGGHEDGIPRLSLWSAEDGTFVRVIDSGREVDCVCCIDMSADESVAVTGHKNGTALVWETKRWTVRCALEGHRKDIVCVAVLREGNRVLTVDRSAKCRVWDAESGSVALSVVKTGLTEISISSNSWLCSLGQRTIYAGDGWPTLEPNSRKRSVECKSD